LTHLIISCILRVCLKKRGILLEHYFTNNSNLKSNLREIDFEYQDIKFKFLSDDGVFSKNKIDYASEVLVKTFLKNVTGNGNILDIGCGYGFIGIVLGKVLSSKIVLSDVNKRALHLTEENIKKNEVNGQVIESDAYKNISGKYKYIISNPPIRAGNAKVLEILNGAVDYLDSDGELWFVINKNQGAKSIEKRLEKYKKVEILEKSKGFYVFRAKID